MKKRDAEAKKPPILNKTANITGPKDEWPNFYKGRSYIRDDSNKTEEEEEDDDTGENNEQDRDDSGETEADRLQR